MGDLKVGDIVGRKSYGCDIFFKVTDIKESSNGKIITLKGISYRIQADAPEADLEVQSDQLVNEHKIRMEKTVEKRARNCHSGVVRGGLKKTFFRDTSKEVATKFLKSGKVLHIDGDNDYLTTCQEEYKKLNINAICKHVQEKDQAAAVYRLLQEYKPDILVLTGHDGMIKGESSYLSLDNYRNSRFYIEAVKEARKYEKNYDNLVIFAGACQSMYNGIMNAGSNFASSPYRVLIHALDPVFVCQKIAFASFYKILEPKDVIANTITGVEGIGGIQTLGKFREGYPEEPYK